MSRIDEALARARAGQPQDVAGIAGAMDAVEAEFPVEEPQASSAPPPAAIADDAIAQFPVEAADSISAEEHLATEAPLGHDEGYARLPVAEKLMSGQVDPASVEQYRRLAARLHLSQTERGTRVVVVTSALVGEGKTLTATNLAMTLSESYKRRVLLIDADLRRPWVHELFQVPNLSGLNDGLRASGDRKVPVIRFSEYLAVLTAGRPDSDPMSVLTSGRMRRILDDAAATFDWVIIDTPPVALLTDAHLLASMVDSVLLVVRAGRTPVQAIRKATDAVGRDKVFGVVLNCVEGAAGLNEYQYYAAAQKGVAAIARVPGSAPHR